MNKITKEQQVQLLNKYGSRTQELFWKLGKELILPKGKVCIRSREETTNIYFILSGKVQIYNLTGCGKKKILFILGPGQIANESLASSRSSVFCETLEDCRFYVLRQELLWDLMKEDFLFSKDLLAYQEKKIWRLEHQLKNTVGSIYLERKLATKLLKMARDFGVDTEKGRMIDLDLSVTFLADFLGAPRETTSRVCKRLMDYKLIEVDRKRIWIPDKNRLVAFYKTGVLPE